MDVDVRKARQRATRIDLVWDSMILVNISVVALVGGGVYVSDDADCCASGADQRFGPSTEIQNLLKRLTKNLETLKKIALVALDQFDHL